MLNPRMFLQSSCAAAIVLAAGLTSAFAQQTVAPLSATPVPGPLPEVLQKYAPVTAERLKNPEDGNWFHFRRTYNGWGFSPLKGNHAGQRRTSAIGLEHGDRPDRRSSGAADRQQRRDVRGDPGQPGDRHGRQVGRHPVALQASGAGGPGQSASDQPRRRALRRQGLFRVGRLRAGRARRQNRQGRLGPAGRRL